MRRVVAAFSAVILTVFAAIIPTSSAHAAGDCRATTKRFAGEFISPGAGAAGDAVDPATGTSWGWWDADEWNDEMLLARQLCVDDVILQWTAQTWAGTAVSPDRKADTAPPCVQTDAAGSGTRTLYPSAHPDWETSRLSYVAPTGCAHDSATHPVKRQDVVGLALEAAKAAGRKVWLGLVLQDDTGVADAGWMSAHTGRSMEVASELWNRYGSTYADQIAGFYLPIEANNVEYSTDPSAGTAHARYANLLEYTRTVCAHLRRLAGEGIGILTSPYHVAHTVTSEPRRAAQQTALETYRRVVAGLTTGTGVTAYAPQDSLGGISDPAAAAAWMAAARQGVDDARAAGSDVQLWANIEQYAMQGSGSQPIGQLLSHMEDVNAPALVGGRTISAHVDRFIGFSLANFSRRWYLYGQSAGLRAAYAHYLANPASSLTQTVPPVTGLTATAVAATLDVSVQWSPVAAMPRPAAGVAPAPVLGYVVYRNGVQVGHVSQRFSPDRGADGFHAADTTGPMTFTDPSVRTGQSVIYDVAAFDAYGNLSPRVQAEVVIPLGASDVLSSGSPAAAPGVLRVSDNASYSAVRHGADPGSLWDGLAAGDPAGAYVDGRRVDKVVDGHVGEARYEDPAWVGLATDEIGAARDARAVEIVLPAEVPVHAVRTHWLSDTRVGVSAPAPSSVTVGTRTGQSQLTAPPYETLIAAAELSSGINPDGSKAGVAVPDPGTGWYTDALLGAATKKATSVRISVSAAPGSAWAFLSEVQVLTPGGENVCSGGACTARLLTADGGAAAASAYAPSSGRTLTAPHALRASDGTLTPTTYPWDAAGQSVGWTGSAPFDLVVDLGAEQPIGEVSSDWFDTIGGARAPSVSAFVLAEVPGRSAAPDLAGTAPWLPLPTARSDSGSISTYTARPALRADGAPLRARWVKLVVTPSDSWSIATDITVTTPQAWDAVHCGAACHPRVYKTASDAAAIPGSVAPLSSSGEAVPEDCGPTGSPCATDNPAGSAVLTQPLSSTDDPDYAYIRDNGLTLRPSASWDIVAPLGVAGAGGVARGCAPTISLVFSPAIGSALPASIDLYLSTSGDAPADPADPDGSRVWRAVAGRANAPAMPTYIPADTAFIHTYTFPEVAPPTGQSLDALRFHLNTGGAQAIATRVQAGTWR